MKPITITGQVHTIHDLESFGWGDKRKIWVTVDQDTEYPQTLELVAIKDRTRSLIDVKQGDMIEAECNLRGRTWTNPKTQEERCFIELQVWRLRPMSAEVAGPETEEPLRTDDIPF